MFFELKGVKYPIKMNYRESLMILPEKFGINLCKIFTDGDAAANTMQALILDDELTLKLAWYYIEEKASFDWEEFLELMEGKDLERFREDFWAAVVNFSGVLKRNLLQEMWNQFKRDLKKAELMNTTSDVLPSDSNPGA
jgi:hypothetical protein